MLPEKYSKYKRDLVVKKSSTGLGLVTRDEIKKSEFVIEYIGVILNRKEADKNGGKYLFETSHDRFINGSLRSNLARYINHSCRPNCEIEIRRGHILIFSKRKINPGEELNYDYGEEYFDEFIKPIGCRCLKCNPPRKN